ncbi:MAG: alanine--tRNA ligase [Verrucomicrobia bacterium]|nr:alanine--tRNA ligase [Verrucomicrobiota bacterium]
MTSTQIRQSFLDFFKSKQHSIVPSASLMPDSPNLLFTNAGMNQFVPIFLGQTRCPYTPGRAADTQKCIRAGGKHNDLEDVGLDTYHHTFFEMLGNWSFGDYFKKEAIEWAWELVVGVWKFPPSRLYATVYNPDKSRNDPSEFDQEAWNFWAEKFRSVGLDPAVHIVNGNKKDNFWMMGETGPCGPCSELHMDLTPGGDTHGSLVNQGDARCIEIWNLVFIQFNANPDGTFSLLPAQHVDTGMGFERVTSIIQGTKNLTDFANAKISNYETDIFRPIFDELEKLSGKKYGSTLPTVGQASRLSQTSENDSGKIIEGDRRDACPTSDQIALDITFRVIADHIRTLSFAIADGIQPGNNDRNYVLRRILRRAVMFGRILTFQQPFLYKLVGVLAETMGDVFPEIRERQKHVEEVIRFEEETFAKTYDKGIEMFNSECAALVSRGLAAQNESDKRSSLIKEWDFLSEGGDPSDWSNVVAWAKRKKPTWGTTDIPRFSDHVAFMLYDTYGFPVEETERLAKERGIAFDIAGFNKLMEEQRARARAAQKKEVIELSANYPATEFVGYAADESDCRVLAFESQQTSGGNFIHFAVVDKSPLYAEMGGQVGDSGILKLADARGTFEVSNTTKRGQTFYLMLKTDSASWAKKPFEPARLIVNRSHRRAIERHHTVTHLLHWALHEVVSRDASQKGSFVGPDKLTFDFNSAPLTPAQVADIEKLVNERILENAGVSWTEIPYADVKSRKDVMQFFGDKYGDTVRVVQIGGGAGELNGYSMELCGGTHTRATGEIGLFRIVGESAIAAGVRRIEAVAGLTAYDVMKLDRELIKAVAGKVNSPIHELEKKIEALMAQQKKLEKEIQIARQRNASNAASELLERVQTVNGIPLITHNLGDADGDFLQAIADSLKGRFKGVVVLGGLGNNAVALVATVSPDYIAKVQAGKIIQAIAPIVGGKGGGKPDNARGGGKDASKLDEALGKAKSLLG